MITQSEDHALSQVRPFTQLNLELQSCRLLHFIRVHREREFDVGIRKHSSLFLTDTGSWDWQDLDVMPRAEVSEVQLPNIVRERGGMGVEHVQPTCLKNVNTSEENYSSRKRGRSDGGTNLEFREDNATRSTGFSYWVIKSRHLLQKIESLNKSKPPFDREEACTKYPILAAASGVQMSFPRPEPTARLIKNGSSAVASSTCTWFFQPSWSTFSRKL